jgi:hypothetical protein
VQVRVIARKRPLQPRISACNGCPCRFFQVHPVALPTRRWGLQRSTAQRARRSQRRKWLNAGRSGGSSGVDNGGGGRSGGGRCRTAAAVGTAAAVVAAAAGPAVAAVAASHAIRRLRPLPAQLPRPPPARRLGKSAAAVAAARRPAARLLTPTLAGSGAQESNGGVVQS